MIEHFAKIVCPLTTNVPDVETSQLICRTNQLTGFYIRGILVVKRLTLFLQKVPS